MYSKENKEIRNKEKRPQRMHSQITFILCMESELLKLLLTDFVTIGGIKQSSYNLLI